MPVKRLSHADRNNATYLSLDGLRESYTSNSGGATCIARIFLPTPGVSIDVRLAQGESWRMANLLPKSQRIVRTLLSSVVASLFLLQVVAFIFSLNGRVAFSSGEAGASITMAGENCRAMTDDGGKAPAQPSHHHHCAVCCIGRHDDAIGAVADLAQVIIGLTPRSGDAPAWFVHDELALRPLGWTSSWSSRAPPAIS